MSKKKVNHKNDLGNSCIAGGIAFLSSLTTNLALGMDEKKFLFSIGMGILIGLLTLLIKLQAERENTISTALNFI
jgi:hypothetical protein